MTTPRVGATCASLGAALGAALGITLGGARVAAQTTPRDTVRRPTPSDSAARDSVVTRTLAQDTAGAVRPAAFSALGLDRLRLRTVGGLFGFARPGQAVGTQIYSLNADYGELWRGVRVIFSSSYWSTRYRDDEVAQLAREVRRVVSDPTSDDSVRIGRVRLSDLSVGTDLRWEPGVARRAHALARAVHPWVSGGVAVHLVNVEGAPLSGTFVERALDAAAVGLAGAVGLDLKVLPNLQLTAEARYDFMSGVRYGSARAGVSFVFDPTVP